MRGYLTILVLATVMGSTAYATDQSFNVTMKLRAPIVLTEVTPLVFPDQTTGTAQDITVVTRDAGAASFTATGGRNRSIARSVVESSINMDAGIRGDNIAVDTFVLGGPTAFDGGGNITGLKVGAGAHILATNPDGDYTGTATLRIVYN